MWMCERILNARVPHAVRPLLFDCKIIGLEKSSQMALDIERMAAQADAAVGAAGAAETVSVGDLGRRDGELGHGEQAGR